MARRKQLLGTKRGQKKKSRFLPYLFDRARSLSLSLPRVRGKLSPHERDTRDRDAADECSRSHKTERENGYEGEIISGRDMTPVDGVKGKSHQESESRRLIVIIVWRRETSGGWWWRAPSLLSGPAYDRRFRAQDDRTVWELGSSKASGPCVLLDGGPGAARLVSPSVTIRSVQHDEIVCTGTSFLQFLPALVGPVG
jgi:hypothetical protein